MGRWEEAGRAWKVKWWEGGGKEVQGELCQSSKKSTWPLRSLILLPGGQVLRFGVFQLR